MASSKFFHGSSLLIGDNTVPGVKLPKELREHAQTILKACHDWGLDFYPTVVQLLTYDEISEVAAYGGFPVRYPHWSFGMQYEELQRGYEFGAHKIYEMVVNCCELATSILTQDGKKRAEDVLVGDKVMGPNGWRDVVAVKRQKPSQVMEIRCHELGNKIVCTPNHKWKCVRDGKSVWVETKDIIPGDAIQGGSDYACFLNKPAKIEWSEDKVVSETRSNVRNRLIKINPPKSMTVELAELMGILAGDGSVGVRLSSQVLCVCIHKPLVEYQNRVADLFLEVFGRRANISPKKRSVNNVVLCSKFAVDFMNSAGLSTGCTYKNKRVPRSIWASSNEYRAAFIRGLFDTDGHCSRSLSLSCFNDDLANDVQLLLLEMGIRSKVFRVKNKHNDIAILTIKGKRNIRLFSQHVGFSIDYKAKALEVLAARDGRSGRGQSLPGVMRVVFDRIDQMERPPENFYKWRRRTLEKDMTSNALWGFLNHAIESGYEETFGDLFELVDKPVYVVSSVDTLEEKQETIDIALDHCEHDFLANGLVSHNTNPCYIYCLDSNTLLDHLTVIAHATGHNDFFKNNIFFSATDTNMLNNMANHASRIKKYMTRWGKEKVTEFLDYLLRIDTLIDGAAAWHTKVVRDKNIVDKRNYRFPRRLRVDPDRLYMDDYINTRDFKDRENDKVKERDIADELGFLMEPVKDVLGFLRDNAPLKPWQQDIMSMIYDESLYFYPQRQTKVLNEGWASLTDSVIMAEQGFVGLGQKTHDSGIVEYATHKMGVLGGKYSTNPYKLGFNLLSDIRDRWNKGRFGPEWEECRDSARKESWDTGAMLGKDKVFEVRKYYDDLTLIHEFFTEDFCREQEYFEWRRYADGETMVESHDYPKIKRLLMARHVNGGLPDIRLTEHNYRGKGYLMLEHNFEGRPLYEPYIRDVMVGIRFIWGNDVFLSTKGHDGTEIIFECSDNDPQNVRVRARK